jgi:hypothetical protein
MSGRTLEIVMSLFAVWALAHGFKALRHWRARKPMTMSYWQGGLIGDGKVVRGASLWVLGWSNVALVVAMGLWLGRVAGGVWTDCVFRGRRSGRHSRVLYRRGFLLRTSFG